MAVDADRPKGRKRMSLFRKNAIILNDMFGTVW